MFFSLQVRLLKRGLELLEVGGRIVYSTCSLNPVEDEAVLCTVLTQMKGLCCLLAKFIFVYFECTSVIFYLVSFCIVLT